MLAVQRGTPLSPPQTSTAPPCPAVQIVHPSAVAGLHPRPRWPPFVVCVLCLCSWLATGCMYTNLGCQLGQTLHPRGAAARPSVPQAQHSGAAPIPTSRCPSSPKQPLLLCAGLSAVLAAEGALGLSLSGASAGLWRGRPVGGPAPDLRALTNSGPSQTPKARGTACCRGPRRLHLRGTTAAAAADFAMVRCGPFELTLVHPSGETLPEVEKDGQFYAVAVRRGGQLWHCAGGGPSTKAAFSRPVLCVPPLQLPERFQSLHELKT